MSLLPIHGFVLAGGKSSRMGTDKALLLFRGRPMIEIAVEKLRSFCTEVSIAGNREDLPRFAPIAPDIHADAGPVAGIAAGLMACRQPWALFTPVDVPLLPAAFLHRWAAQALHQAEHGCGLSLLSADGREQPAFCLIAQEYAGSVQEIVAGGERRIRHLLSALEQDGRAGWMWEAEAHELADDLLDSGSPHLQIQNWFTNLNTPDQLLYAAAGLGPE